MRHAEQDGPADPGRSQRNRLRQGAQHQPADRLVGQHVGAKVAMRDPRQETPQLRRQGLVETHRGSQRSLLGQARMRPQHDAGRITGRHADQAEQQRDHREHYHQPVRQTPRQIGRHQAPPSSLRPSLAPSTRGKRWRQRRSNTLSPASKADKADVISSTPAT